MIPLRYNEAQIMLHNTTQWFRDHRIPIRIIICKCRRAGLSTGVAAQIYDDMTTVPNTWSLIVANQIKPSENVLSMYTRFWLNTPEKLNLMGEDVYIRPPLPDQYRNKPPRDEMIFEAPLSSRIFVATSKSLEAYLSFGFQNIHATEAAHYEDGDELFANLYPTLSTDAHSALYVESTPFGREGRGSWFFRQCSAAADNTETEYGQMKLVFIPWHKMRYSFSLPFASDAKERAFVKSYTVEEKEILRKYPYIEPAQFLWRRVILRGPVFNLDAEKFGEKYPEDLTTAFLSTGSSVFAPKTIRRLMGSVKDPVWVGDVYWGEPGEGNEPATYDTVRRPHFLSEGEARSQGRRSHLNERRFDALRVWRWPRKGEQLFLCCDVGGGDPMTKNADYSVITVGALNAWGQDEYLMRWRGHLNPVAFGWVCATLAWAVRYQVGENAVAPELVPEWTGPGRATCTEIDIRNLYPNLYRYQVPGVHGFPKSKHIGWESNAKTKALMVNYMLMMVNQRLIEIPDERLVDEMASYKQLDPYSSETSFGGAAGIHDDLVTGFSMLCAMLRIRSITATESSGITELDDTIDLDASSEDEAFDPFAVSTPIPGLPGVMSDDLDDENMEEALFWSVG